MRVYVSSRKVTQSMTRKRKRGPPPVASRKSERTRKGAVLNEIPLNVEGNKCSVDSDKWPEEESYRGTEATEDIAGAVDVRSEVAWRGGDDFSDENVVDGSRKRRAGGEQFSPTGVGRNGKWGPSGNSGDGTPKATNSGKKATQVATPKAVLEQMAYFKELDQFQLEEEVASGEE